MTDLIKQFEVLLSFPRGIVVWINFTSVIPWLDRGIQLKILKLLVFFIVFMDPVVKPRDDRGEIDPHNNAFLRKRKSSTLKLF
ncbi:palindromic element RPE4 domain-containing protein [Rickettsia conorii]|uniref:palindromic element RPE4 domain-containing protein n=1 Tax=Rickettsia conorii TaxID=781 RepID=UPI0002E760B1|nr:palindromic element RPE4 domain-containing protein [Rickettsia conorii]